MKKLFLIFIIFCIMYPIPVMSKTITTKHSLIIGPGGKIFHRYGNFIYTPDGKIYQQYGNFIYTPDGKIYQRFGSFIHTPKGEIYTVID